MIRGGSRQESERTNWARNWERDIKTAKVAILGMERHGADEIVWAQVRFGMRYEFAMGQELFTNEPVTLTCPKAILSPLESKWFKRPLTSDRQAEVMGTIVEGLRRIAREKPPVNPPSLSSALDGHIAIGALYDDGTDIAFHASESHPATAEWLANRLWEIRDSVPPDDRGTAVGLSRLSSLTYVSDRLPEGRRKTIVIERGETDGSCMLTHDERRANRFTKAETELASGEHVLSPEDWNELLVAILRADIPHWADNYENPATLDKGFHHLSLEFDDGWGLDIRGTGEWDDRFAPILGFIESHDPEEG